MTKNYLIPQHQTLMFYLILAGCVRYAGPIFQTKKTLNQVKYNDEYDVFYGNLDSYL